MKNYDEMSIKDIIRTLRISIAEDGERLHFYSETKKKVDVDAACAAVKARKPEIMAYLRGKAEKEAEYQRRVEGIEGVKEIRAAMTTWEKYRDKFNDAMERGDGILPNKPTVDVALTCRMYPRANAYLLAEDYVCSEHYIKSGIGTKTLEKIIYDDHAPEDRQYWANIIAAMKKEWEDYCIAHMWD